MPGPDLGQLAGGKELAFVDQPSVARGVITRAPANPTDSLDLTLWNMSASHVFTCAAGHWDARGAGLPAVGTQCAVLFDDNQDVWVSVWDGHDQYMPIPPHAQARANHEGAFDIPAGALWEVPLNTVQVDPGNNVVAGRRYVAPATGYYAVAAQLKLSCPTPGTQVAVALYKNSFVLSAGDTRTTAMTNEVVGLGVAEQTAQLAAGDWLEVYLYASQLVHLATGPAFPVAPAGPVWLPGPSPFFAGA